MKIAIVLNTSWNIYNFRLGLINELRNNGATIYAIAPRDTYSSLLEKEGCKFVPIQMDSRGANPVKDILLLMELYKIYRDMRPDVVFHYTIKPNIYGTLAASALGIPVINNVCGLGTVFLKKGLSSRIAQAMYRIAFRYPKKVFFQNADDCRLFVNKKIIKQEITDVIPGSGIDLEKFKPQASTKKRPKFTFLLISRLIHDKGVMEYIEAIKQLKNQGVEADFQILGPMDPGHKRGIRVEVINDWLRMGLVEYLGTTNDVRKYIHEADCIVLPSYREGTPRTLLEAASSGKPIVATDVPGCNSVVSHNHNGFLCKQKDSGDLAEKMRAMANLQDSKREEFGINGRKKMESQFKEHKVIDKYIQALHEIGY